MKIGPIPTGTPINLCRTSIWRRRGRSSIFCLTSSETSTALPPNATDEQARQQFAPLVPKLLEVSKCRDFVVNKGHYFGTDFLPPGEGEPGLSDADRLALIEFLKTF